MTTAWTLAVLWVGALWSGRHWLDPAGRAAVFPLPASGWPGPWALENAVRSAGSLLFGGLFLYMCDAAGRTVLRCSLGACPAGPLRLAAPLLAWLALGTGLLGLAAVGLWRPVALWGAAGLLGWLALPSLRASAAEWSGAARALWSGLSPAGRIAAGLLVGWLAWLLTPPEVTFDVWSYDLAYPQQLLVTGRLFSTDVWSHWIIPLPAEFPYVYPLLAGLESAARVIALGCAGFGVLAGWRALAPDSSVRASAVVALAALVLPAARSGLVTSKSDAFAVGYAAAAAGLLVSAGAFGSGRVSAARFAAGALLLGGTVAVKYLTLPLAAALGIAVILRRVHRERPAVFAVVTAGALAPMLPWLARAWLSVGDPLPPIGWAVFPGLAPDAEAAARTGRLFTAYVRDMRAPSGAPVEMLVMLATNAWPLVAVAPWLRRRPALPVAILAGYAGLVIGIRGAIEHVERFCHPGFTLLLLVAFSRLADAPRAVIRGARWPVAVAVALAVAGLGRFEWWPGGSLQRWHLEYHLGRLDAETMRRRGMLAYGALQPRLLAAAHARPGRAVLAIGEFQFHGIPARVRTAVFEPPPVWRAAREARTPGRIAVSFRQGNIGLVLHNQYLADWARHTDAPFVWTDRMLRVWMAFARCHLRPAGWSGRIDPNYGSPWLYLVEPEARPSAGRIPFLPGIEPALAYASLAAANGNPAAAAERFAVLARVLPELAFLDALRGGALLRLGRPGEAYRWLAAADAAGVNAEWTHLDLAVAAARTGRGAVSRNALRRAAEVLPLWPERLAEATRRAGHPHD